MRYEVALELLGQLMQPYVQVSHNERQKDKPNQTVIDYCWDRIRALSLLQDNLHPFDDETIDKILDPQQRKFFE
jgi:hypothetical protein